MVTRMFPLGSVVFPHQLIPLHVFAPRYRRLMEDTLAGDGTFGITLIERGPEVGGGDRRTSTGTLVRVVEHQRLEDGRYVLVGAGARRLEVTRWLEDDPYPRAETRPRPEGPVRSGDAARAADVERDLHRLLLLYSEAGVDVGRLEFTLDPDPAVASFQAAVLAPLGPLDAQRLLEIDAPGDRLVALSHHLAEHEADLRRRLAAG